VSDSARISPTAHYTGQVWCRHGLSPKELSTAAGRAMFEAMRVPMRVAALGTGGLTLEKMLLQRHLILDHLLDEAIEAGRIGQVVEVAAGLSGRGLRLTKRHRGLVYVEADLPAMAERKRAMIASLISRTASHRVVAVDALSDEGPLALARVLEGALDPEVGTAIITEGLLSYFSRELVEGIWARFAAALHRYPRGLYMTDIHFAQGPNGSPLIRAFRILLGAFARGAVHLHHQDEGAMRAAMRAAGFDGAIALTYPSELEARLALPRGNGDYLCIASAETTRSP
jgi:O-methyltransferase involved in polyketide biosynthesis